MWGYISKYERFGGYMSKKPYKNYTSLVDNAYIKVNCQKNAI